MGKGTDTGHGHTVYSYMQGCIADEVALSVDFEDVESMKGGNYLSSRSSFSSGNPTNWLLMFKSTLNSGALDSYSQKHQIQRPTTTSLSRSSNTSSMDITGSH
jgi:hypothetical protein